MGVRILAIGLAAGFGASAFGFSTSADGAAAHFTFVSGDRGYHAVVADTGSDLITPTAQVAPRLTNVWRLISQSQPVAAITGTFFAWENGKPVADVVVDGTQVATGYRGSILAVDWFGKPHILDTPTRKPFDYHAYRYAVRGGVRVLQSGVVANNPRSQGFTDSSIWGSAARTAVGITATGKLMFVATRSSVTLSALGKAMKSQGAVDALAMDGGGSTMLYFDGDLKISPNRGLCNLLLIEKRSPYDEAFRTYLARLGQTQAEGSLKGVMDSAGTQGER
ncbi:MAG: phosphodiester glycosidase family protein [Fimbriimonadaceae bacterium]|nr:phosphodiester glycosidase family protein [Fimbriimonadaceae bacterium]